MIYDVAQSLCNHAPRFPGQPPNSVEYQQFAVVNGTTAGTFILLKIGWGEKRGNSKKFLTAWPYMSGNGAQYLLDRQVKGMGIDGLSTDGYPDKHGAAWTHLIVWDEGDLESNSSAPELATTIPLGVAAAIALQRGLA